MNLCATPARYLPALSYTPVTTMAASNAGHGWPPVLALASSVRAVAGAGAGLPVARRVADSRLLCYRVAILLDDGVDAAGVAELQAALQLAGVQSHLVAPHLGTVICAEGGMLVVDHNFDNLDPNGVDAVFVAAGCPLLAQHPQARAWVEEAYDQGKVIGAAGEGAAVLSVLGMDNTAVPTQANEPLPGVVVSAGPGQENHAALARRFITAMGLRCHALGDFHTVPAAHLPDPRAGNAHLPGPFDRTSGARLTA